MADTDRLTEDIIDQIRYFNQAIPHFTKYDLSLEGVTDIFTAKLRLRQFVQQADGTESSIRDATALMLKLKEEHDKCTEQLQGLFQSTTLLLPDVDDGISGQLGNGQLTAEFSQRLKQSVPKLISPKCPILVAGETSSGKSSLLNLILGEEMLPTSTLSTTSIICELRHGEQRKAKVFTWDDQEIDVPLEDSSSDKKSLEKISAYIHQKENRDQEIFPYKRVEIYLPLEFLKGGITIVDSPGVGESEKMDEVVFDYMQEAFAFIYVINSANAGGIQKDRLGRLINAVSTKGREQLEDGQLKSNSRKDATTATFSSRSAIFVCNKWDQVPVHEAQIVQDEQLRVLRRYWPGCTEDQVFQLCTSDATKALQHGVVMKDYRHLLDGIERLIPISLRNKLKVYHSLLEQVLCRIKFMLNATMANADTETKERQERLHKAQNDLDILKRNSFKRIKEMKDTLNGHMKHCVDRLSNLLETDSRVQQLVTPSSNFIEESDVHIAEKEFKSMVCFRLQNFIMDWEEQEGHFKKVKTNTEEMFRKELSKIEREMSAMEQNLTGQTGTDDTEQVNLTEIEGISSGTSRYEESVIDLKILDKLQIGVPSPLSIPLDIIESLLSSPAMFSFSPKGIFKMLFEIKSKQEFNENKLEYMRKQGLRVLEKFKERETLRVFVENQLRPSYIFLDRCEESIGEAIESNEKLIEHLKGEGRPIEKVKQGVGRLQEEVENIQDKLTIFGIQHVKAFDFEKEQVTVEETIASGTFANIARGKLQEKKKATSCEVLVKVFKERSDATILRIVSEEKCLRTLWNLNDGSAKPLHIILLLGASRGPIGIPMLILEPARRSLRSFLGRGEITSTSQNKKVAMSCVGKGLEYLHNKGMVHIELSMDTVLVKTDGTPKLTSPCEPQRIELPETADALASPYVYLAPEVLRGGVYKKSADMYSVGLMMWEMWSLKKISEVDKKGGLSLQQLLTKNKPAEDPPTIHWQSMMSKNLSVDPFCRWSCSEWLAELKDDKSLRKQTNC
ncbi:uncharacterized protein LOC118424923 [Branchiostoma floridae]|uniref:Uncharacterized protein LOC118424923 n=1 Tax=Branchiostoma floridae TaxID=7739 RepID=C3Z8J8_BRAFL|nr:uncharacterized protein LOC118424923 [Branchiostoma floridae]|eukprot:XP_002595092.1 hypothetical protein BRAFLDRAFT_90202 [Branchiostoma floridae]